MDFPCPANVNIIIFLNPEICQHTLIFLSSDNELYHRLEQCA